MSTSARAVQVSFDHIIDRGDHMANNQVIIKQYGDTVIHIVDPVVTPEETQTVLDQFHQAAYRAWNSLSKEKQLALNKQAKEN